MVVRSIITLSCGVVLISLHTQLRVSEAARLAAETRRATAELALMVAEAAASASEARSVQLAAEVNAAEDAAQINSLEMELNSKKPQAE